MARKSFARSMTIESPIAETEIVADEVSMSAPAQEPAPEPKAEIPLPDGVVATQWAGIPMWHCTKCSVDTFDEKAARDHVCNPYFIR